MITTQHTLREQIIKKQTSNCPEKLFYSVSMYVQVFVGKRYLYSTTKCHTRDPQVCQLLQRGCFAQASELSSSALSCSRFLISRAWVLHARCQKARMTQTSVGSVPLTSVTDLNKICIETPGIFAFHSVRSQMPKVQW